MCLIVFSWNPKNEYPLVLLANRDEFYQRATLPIHYWKENSNIFGGKDLESGGSWLAISKTGRLAAVTNFREVPAPVDKKSRGDLVRNFVGGQSSASEYLSQISEHADIYSGFNLLVWDGSTLCYFSNRQNRIKTLSPGIYGLSNYLLNTPWPKLIKARGRFSQHLEQQVPDHDQLIHIMHDNEQAPDDQLPETGVGLEKERFLSSCFIKSESYGTRNTSALTLNSEGLLRWVEQGYGSNGKTGDKQLFEIKITSPAMMK